MKRTNPLLYEVDGDFNPGWLLFIVFSALGAGISLGALVVALRSTNGWPAVVAALSFVAFAMLCTAIIVVPIAKAKLLAPALRTAAGSIGVGGGGYSGYSGDTWSGGDGMGAEDLMPPVSHGRPIDPEGP